MYKRQIIHYGFCQEEQLFVSSSPDKEWKRLGIRAKNTILSFHHKSLIARELELKAENEYQLQNAIQEEIQKYQIDVNEEYDFDYIIQSYNPESSTYLTKTAGISKRINREYIEKARYLGLNPKAVGIQVNDTLRVLRKISECCPNIITGYPFLLLDLGYDSTTVAMVNSTGIIALKNIANGSRQINGMPEEVEEYLHEVTVLCYQIINHFTLSCFSHEIQQGFLYGGGSFSPDILHRLQEQIPIHWKLLSSFQSYLPEIPHNMNLNLYASCLGSLYWEADRIKQERGNKK